MKVENYIQVRLPISSKTQEFRLGKDASLYTDKVCEPMIEFLCEQFNQNPDCLIGDIRSLYNRKKEIDKKRLGEMTYGEYLNNKLQKSL